MNTPQVEVIVASVSHYKMDNGNSGLSVQLLNKLNQTDFKFGLDITESKVPDYGELEYLKQYADKLPAKFRCNFEFVSMKDRNNKVVSTIALSNLQFVCPVDLLDKQTEKAGIK